MSWVTPFKWLWSATTSQQLKWFLWRNWIPFSPGFSSSKCLSKLTRLDQKNTLKIKWTGLMDSWSALVFSKCSWHCSVALAATCLLSKLYVFSEPSECFVWFDCYALSILCKSLSRLSNVQPAPFCTSLCCFLCLFLSLRFWACKFSEVSSVFREVSPAATTIPSV